MNRTALSVDSKQKEDREEGVTIGWCLGAWRIILMDYQWRRLKYERNKFRDCEQGEVINRKDEQHARVVERQ